MRKILPEENKRKNVLSLRLVVLGLVFFLMTLSAEIWIVNRLSTYGDKIYQLKQAQANLELENQVLANSIAEASSMMVLEQKATLLGFNNINQIEYIRLSDQLASAK